MTSKEELPPHLLRSFLAVADTRSFTAAGTRLGLGQSTVSQHIMRMEGVVGRRLLMRDTHSVSLTEDGDAMLEFARNVLEANERMTRFFSGKGKRERLRLGISEDFAMSGLASVLTAFRRRDPQVDIELTVGLTDKFVQHVYDRHDRGYGLRVRRGNEPPTPGFFRIAGDWSHGPGRPAVDGGA